MRSRGAPELRDAAEPARELPDADEVPRFQRGAHLSEEPAAELQECLLVFHKILPGGGFFRPSERSGAEKAAAGRDETEEPKPRRLEEEARNRKARGVPGNIRRAAPNRMPGRRSGAGVRPARGCRKAIAGAVPEGPRDLDETNIFSSAYAESLECNFETAAPGALFAARVPAPERAHAKPRPPCERPPDSFATYRSGRGVSREGFGGSGKGGGAQSVTGAARRTARLESHAHS